MKLGNKEDAKLIYRRRKTGYGPLPKGWKRLGAGSFRTSYLSPDGVVYKVCHDDHSFNELEFKRFTKIRLGRIRLPKGWRVAPVKIYSFVDNGEEIHIIAMQYIKGTHHKVSEDMEWEDVERLLDDLGATRAFSKCGMWDVHEENFLVTPTGKNVIIDLGE